MSLSYLRDAIMQRLGEQADKMTNAAINIMVHPDMRADGYALSQADKLAQARAFVTARQIVVEEYKKMTEVETLAAKTEAEAQGQNKPKKDERIYG